MEIDLDELQSLVAWAGERGAETGREESPFSIHHSPIELIGELVRRVRSADGMVASLQSENQTLAARCLSRVEELQVAVQARVAAEKRGDELLAELEQARSDIGKLPAPIFTDASGRNHLVGSPMPVFRVMEKMDAAIAKAKGGTA